MIVVNNIEFINAEMIEKGISFYLELNNNERRKGLECEASSLMAKDYLSYDLYKEYLCGDFLKWMGADLYNRWNEEFCKDIEGKFTADDFDLIGSSKSEYSLLYSHLEKKEIRGAGPVTLSAMIALIRPTDYGIVNRHVVYALNDIEKKYQNSHKNITKDTVCEVVSKMQRIRDNNPFLLSGRKTRTRDIDMALWGLGKVWSSKNK